MEGSIFYIAAFIGIVLFLIIVKTLKDSIFYNQENEKYFISVLNTVGFIIEEFNIKNRNVVKLVQMCYIALDIVNQVEGIDSPYDKKKEIELIALSLAAKNDISLGDELVVKVVDRVADYIIASEMNEFYIETQ